MADETRYIIVYPNVNYNRRAVGGVQPIIEPTLTREQLLQHAPALLGNNARVYEVARLVPIEVSIAGENINVDQKKKAGNINVAVRPVTPIDDETGDYIDYDDED